MSRIAVCEFQMKTFYFTNRSQEERTRYPKPSERSLMVMNLHLNYQVAKNKGSVQVKAPKSEYVRYWNKVAETIVKFHVRVVGFDINMSLLTGVSELRRRGILANTAAWCAFVDMGGRQKVH